MNEENDSKFLTRKWNIAIDHSNANYKIGNEIIYSTEVLKSNLCDCLDGYILVRSDFNIIGHQATQVAFKKVHHLLKVSQKMMEQQ